MKCPIDDTTLVISERQGIEIDYCPDCRGVWLDRGELDKLIERSATVMPAGGGGGGGGGQPPKAKKKERGSFLSEIFELGG